MQFLLLFFWVLAEAAAAVHEPDDLEKIRELFKRCPPPADAAKLKAYIQENFPSSTFWLIECHRTVFLLRSTFVRVDNKLFVAVFYHYRSEVKVTVVKKLGAGSYGIVHLVDFYGAEAVIKVCFAISSSFSLAFF